jgi:hypothetical protein
MVSKFDTRASNRASTWWANVLTVRSLAATTQPLLEGTISDDSEVGKTTGCRGSK